MLWGGIFDYDNRLKIIKEYESNTTNPNFWDDKKNAEVVLKKINQNKIWTDSYLEIQNMYDDLVILNDFYISGEADKQEIEKESNKLLKKLERIEFQKMLSSDEDQLNAIIEINPGAGGTESQDWAEILMRMYAVSYTHLTLPTICSV